VKRGIVCQPKQGQGPFPNYRFKRYETADNAVNNRQETSDSRQRAKRAKEIRQQMIYKYDR
jgi:hypothetical protein